MQKNPAAAEVIRRLNTYHDAQALIDEEMRTIEHAQKQRNRISLRSPSMSGLPGGKGKHSDQTADSALSASARMYDEDIKACYKRIAQLRSDRDWVTAALAKLDRFERSVVEQAYLGPKDPERRKKWIVRPTWYAIAASLGVSENYARIQAGRVIDRLAGMVDQIPMEL